MQHDNQTPHSMTASIYMLAFTCFVPSILAAKEKWVAAIVIWGLLFLLYFIFNVQPFRRFKELSTDFGQRFWGIQFTGLLIALLINFLPEHRGIFAFIWGVSAILLVYPIAKNIRKLN